MIYIYNDYSRCLFSKTSIGYYEFLNSKAAQLRFFSRFSTRWGTSVTIVKAEPDAQLSEQEIEIITSIFRRHRKPLFTIIFRQRRIVISPNIPLLITVRVFSSACILGSVFLGGLFQIKADSASELYHDALGRYQTVYPQFRDMTQTRDHVRTRNTNVLACYSAFQTLGLTAALFQLQDMEGRYIGVLFSANVADFKKKYPDVARRFDATFSSKPLRPGAALCQFDFRVMPSY